jgi:hypothetical protein
MDYDSSDSDTHSAAETLVNLQHSPDNNRVFTPPYASLNPIHPLNLTPPQYRRHQQLPPLSNLLISPMDDPFFNQHDCPAPSYYGSSSTSSSTANLLYPPYEDYGSIQSPSRPLSSNSTLVPPLSTSTSFSSFKSIASSIELPNKSKNILSRAATFTRRRSRPRKNPVVCEEERNNTTTGADHITHHHQPHAKPRWQPAEKQELMEAIVKDKELDDMATIRWDRIAMAVGRAKKACKDQWRREILPTLLKNQDCNGKNNKRKKHYPSS